MLKSTAFLNTVRHLMANGIHKATTSRSALSVTRVSPTVSRRLMSTEAKPESETTNQKIPPEESIASHSSSGEELDKLYRNLDLEVRGHDRAVLKSYKWFVMESAKHLGIPVIKTWEPSKVHERRNMLKSAFSHRKHLVQYEARTYYQVILMEKVTGSTADTFLEYIERNIPEGVAMKVTKHEIQPLPEHLRHRPSELAE